MFVICYSVHRFQGYFYLCASKQLAEKMSFGFGQQAKFGAPASTTNAFGTTTSTATTGFAGFGAAKPAAAAPFGTTAPTAAPAFGSTSTTPGFGAPAAAPAFGGFGSTTTAATNPNAFNAFAKPAAPAAAAPAFGSSFGTAAAPAFGGFGQTAPAAGTTANAFGGSFGSTTFGSTQPFQLQQMQQPAKPAENIPFDTPYKDLPANYKTEIDQVYTGFKVPMRQHLDLIQRAKGNGFDELFQQLKKIHLSVMQLETKQIQLKNELQPFLDDLKPFYRDFHTSATNGLTQIRSRFIGGEQQAHQQQYFSVLDEALPDRFYLLHADRLEKRLVSCVNTVQYFEQQLAARIRVLEYSQQGHGSGYGQAGNGMVGSRGAYGQVLRVSPSMLLTLIRQQAEVFTQISAEVALVHQLANDLRQSFLAFRRSRMDNSNPFEIADRKELAERKQVEDKIRLEQQIQQQQSSSQQQQQPQAAGGAATPAATTTFGSFGASTTTAAPATAPAGGFGSFSFGAPATAAPATTPATAGTQGTTTAPALTFGATTGATTTPASGSLTTNALDLASSTKPATTALSFGATPNAAAPAANTVSFGATPATSTTTAGATSSFGGFMASLNTTAGAPTTSVSFPGVASAVSPIKAVGYDASVNAFAGTHKPTSKKK